MFGRLPFLTCCLGLVLPSCGGIAENTLADGDDEPGGEDSGPSVGPGRPTFPSPDSSQDAPLDEPVPDCSGAFAEPTVLFEEPGWLSQALAPSEDGLEFYYARLATDPALDDSGARVPTLRTRRTLDSTFGEPTTLSQVASACEAAKPGTSLAALDLSTDKKRLYLGCSAYVFAAGESGPLLMFERTSVAEGFDLPPKKIGDVGLSLGLTRDELTAYGSSLDPAIPQVVSHARSSVFDTFGPPEIAPGSLLLSNPEPAPSGVELWGAAAVTGSTGKQIVVSSWNSEQQVFDPPVSAGFTPEVGTTDASPALSGGCRTLYFARYMGSPASSTKIMVARR